jgi:hypothetical protein
MILNGDISIVEPIQNDGYFPFIAEGIKAVGDISKAGISLGESKRRIESSKELIKQKKRDNEAEFKRASLEIKTQAKINKSLSANKLVDAVAKAKRNRVIKISIGLVGGLLLIGITSLVVLRNRGKI